MSQSIVQELCCQWFDEYSRLAYWIARRWCRKLQDYRGRAYSANALEELAQDAVCRGYDRLVKRCSRDGAPIGRDRKRWLCQCVYRASFDACRAKSSFGSISSHVVVRDDAMNRCQRVSLGSGDDSEMRDALEQIGYVPVVYACQRWELEQLVSRELPVHLHATAIYAACGLTQDQSATLQGVSARTIRNRLRELRHYLDPSISV